MWKMSPPSGGRLPRPAPVRAPLRPRWVEGRAGRGASPRRGAARGRRARSPGKRQNHCGSQAAAAAARASSLRTAGAVVGESRESGLPARAVSLLPSYFLPFRRRLGRSPSAAAAAVFRLRHWMETADAGTEHAPRRPPAPPPPPAAGPPPWAHCTCAARALRAGPQRPPFSRGGLGALGRVGVLRPAGVGRQRLTQLTEQSEGRGRGLQ